MFLIYTEPVLPLTLDSCVVVEGGETKGRPIKIAYPRIFFAKSNFILTLLCIPLYYAYLT